MPWSRFSLGFIVVILLSFLHLQFLDKWGGFEITYFMIFFILRAPDDGNRRVPIRVLVLIQVFLLSFGADLVLQAAHVKGLAAMSQLTIVYVIMELKRSIVPRYEDLFLLGFFAVFYVADYVINFGLSKAFGLYHAAVPIQRLLFLTLTHTTVMALLLLASIRYTKEPE